MTRTLIATGSRIEEQTAGGTAIVTDLKERARRTERIEERTKSANSYTIGQNR